MSKDPIGNPRDTFIVLIMGGLMIFGPFIIRSLGYSAIIISLLEK